MNWIHRPGRGGADCAAKMGSFGMWVIAIAASVYAVFCLLLYGKQRNMMYLPMPESEAENAQVIRLSGDGETLKIWRLGEGADALVYFGGNAEDVAWNIPAFSAWFPDHSIYLANYRGYGGSSGAPSETGLFADALALYDFARARHRKISLLGRSLGSAVTAYVASEREAHKLALVTPFDSALNLARKMFPIFPVALLLKDRYDTVGRADKISAPVLAIIAAQDKIIPRSRSDALVAAFPAGQISVTVIENAGHNNIGEAAGYAEALTAFFNE